MFVVAFWIQTAAQPILSATITILAQQIHALLVPAQTHPPWDVVTALQIALQRETLVLAPSVATTHVLLKTTQALALTITPAPALILVAVEPAYLAKQQIAALASLLVPSIPANH
jgi:hypothetical protein